ncbi:xanthine dehydrogenase family protein molybdopterin-binding subunit [Stutzerimonas stutzeri]|uniref:xanthine dehydrogenase family protein molybdopterin-binding subunit n=1 Tax=Stutzerimonas stutzeri TaxID=316 RepID=UPI0015E431DD|nr:xanthine dehydrogenase family protein molybdopterin-binding subunit [Stutzerimonas stutzeri]MBA1278830.1 xanthine dehydrogenase family protein molybdopterin-binding subunit [Stutzerimonas stutzeri]
MARPQDIATNGGNFPCAEPVNISRRRFLLASAGLTAGALVIGFGMPIGEVRAAQSIKALPPGSRVPAFLEIRTDNSILLKSPFAEGGQGIFTSLAQIVGEELDASPETFIVEMAPPGGDYQVMENGGRFTGGSNSVRSSYTTMRKLGASARLMLLQTAAELWKVPVAQLTTEPGRVVHSVSGRSVTYGELAQNALDRPVPDSEQLRLKDPKDFRWIGKPVPRLDVYAKSTGKAIYTIDCKVDGMLQASVQHAPRLGLEVAHLRNQEQVQSMPGVHSVHVLPGAVAVVAQRWWTAKRAAEALQVEWNEPAESAALRYMPSTFSTDAYRDKLFQDHDRGDEAEAEGDLAKGFEAASQTVEAAYDVQYLHHAQMEPPSALARFDGKGDLEVWLPNQAPDLFLAEIAKLTGLDPSRIKIHSPLLGGFFGRHFVYPHASPYPQAILLAQAVGRPVKVIWSREEEFLRDPMRPMAVVHMRGGVDAQGRPVVLDAVTVTEGPTEGIANKRGDKIDPTAVEGLTDKHYLIPNRRIAQRYVKTPVALAYWRSVGNSINDFVYEAFLDELADAGKQDPYELRIELLRGNERLTNLLRSVAELAGGWKRGPFTAADGTERARGVAMASPFGSEVAVIAEVSILNGQVKVHDIWQAIDPGSIVNPAIIDAQVNSAVALGLSQALVEQAEYKNGQPVARNYDLYRILPMSMMANVHVKVIESGAKMGGIGEPPLPAVAPAVANALSHLTGQRIRSMPFSKYSFA